VWITYEPGPADDQLDELTGLTGRNEKVLASPVASQGSPIIATAWANQLKIPDAGDARLAQFVNEFPGSFTAPEPGLLCSGGNGSLTL
jgi:hypothetical protein